MRSVLVMSLPLAVLLPSTSQAQQAAGSSNRFAVVAGYSNDSSHIIMGRAQDRKLAYLGIQYDRTLLRRSFGTFAYQAEWRPVVINIDPENHYTGTYQQPGQPPVTGTGSGRVYFCKAGAYASTYMGTTYTEVTTCGQTATFAQSLSPVGFRCNALARSRWQPIASGSGGILLSTRPIPVENAGSFNFLFDFGVGIEYFTPSGRSWRAEYLIQHYSNKETANQNPGVDNGIVKVSCAFVR